MFARSGTGSTIAENIPKAVKGEPPRPTAKRATPFSPAAGLGTLSSCLADLPASITSRGRTFRPVRDLSCFLRTHLETWRIDQIYQHLWFACDRHMPARSLHRHRVSRRDIVVTESPSEHLISDYSVIFVKPLPEYLLSHEFWEAHLANDEDMHAAACGLVLSYTWLVTFRSDFDIAKELRLLPESLTWSGWLFFASSFLDSAEASPTFAVSKRYAYGELRMNRVNYLYKLLPSLWDKDNPVRGFMPTSMWNKSFLERNIARLLTIFVGISLILSALQVGLATPNLQGEFAFVNVSYGFTVASLVFLSLCGLSGIAFIFWHLRYKILRPWRMRARSPGTVGHDF